MSVGNSHGSEMATYSGVALVSSAGKMPDMLFFARRVRLFNVMLEYCCLLRPRKKYASQSMVVR